ncbi:MAG: ABC transporter permease [Jaaginema sp. PMC 1079.18]|nr:ABC transporter permease [Jaaginema sp. PMC 1080.18]MEC4851780.1 ABC transporter permease [Jaaginema sp. PMC 1079.18]MEC4866720.1 ABC transporter permease [Jaaginema sp. PMC 1078.18]
MTTTKATAFQDRIDDILAIFTSETFLYIVKRLLQGLLTLFLVSILSFALMEIAPGNVLDKYKNNPTITAERYEELIEQYALDKPAPTRYISWLDNVVLKGDWGYSIEYSSPVAYLIGQRTFNTLLLAIASIILTWSIAIPLGILSAVKQNTFIDRVLRVISYMGQGIPSFITALFLLFLAQYLTPLLPVGGMTSVNHALLSPVGKVLDIAWHMILPTLALSITSFAGLQRLMRGQLLEVLRQDYIQTARSKGLPENRVIYVHALRNAINPFITILGFEFASLLSGSFIAEFYFNWPGLGRLIFNGLLNQDPNLVMGSLIMGASLLIIGNLLADLLLKFTDPRIKLENLK